MPLRSRWLPLVLTLAIACGGESAGPEAAAILDGTWRGGAAGEGFAIQAVLQLAEEDTVIAGSGYISGSGLECSVLVEGARSGERIKFDLTCPGYLPIRFRGDRTGPTRLEGQVGGSGLPFLDMVLLKQ